MVDNRGLNNEHVIGELKPERQNKWKRKTKERQKKWNMKSGSAMASRPVTSTAESRPNKERDRLRWKS